MPDLLLHHYTSGTGLMGIFDSGTLWASSIHQLNDSSEFKHALDLAKREIAHVIVAINEKYPSTVGARLADLIDRCCSLSVYVASFSQDGDSLSQWRGYCPDGFGYSVAFDEEQLRAIAIAHGFTLRKCIYDQTRQRTLMAAWAQSTIADLAPIVSAAEDQAAFEDRAWKQMSALLLMAPFCKHPSFSEEREWRIAKLVNLDDPTLKLRAGKSMLIRYLPIELSLSPTSQLIWSVCVGPTPHPELAMEAVMHYARKVNIRNGVGCSQSPYRSW